MTIRKVDTKGNDNSGKSPMATVDSDDIPIAEAVEIFPDVEMNATPPANNPNYVSATASTNTIPTGSTATIPTGSTNTIPLPQSAPDPSANNPNSAPARNTERKNLGRNSFGLVCPHCHRQTITTTVDRIGTELICSIIILAIFCWPLCWLPLCLPCCYQTHHFCGHNGCRKKISVTSGCA